MGREIRKVPADWQHPKDDNGRYQPLFDKYYGDACKEWYDNCIKDNGKHIDADGNAHWFHEREGNPPDEKYYRCRNWTQEEATHIQVYETVSEGTPVSPAFATGEELVDYLCEHGDFWDQNRRKDPRNRGEFKIHCDPWTRQNAEAFVNSGFAISGIMVDGKLYGPSEQGAIEERTSCAQDSAPENTAESAKTTANTPSMQLAEPVVE